MADIKWIKITTDIFDDEKMKIIDSMPARDELLVIWFKLLALAGKVNQNGMLFMNSRIAYTPEMLATVFNRELIVVNAALGTFQNFEMITVEDNEVISITNWEKHQNIEGMDKIREQNKIRQRKHREKQLQLTNNNVTVTLHNAIDKDKDKEEDKDKIKNKIKKKTKAELFQEELQELFLDLNINEPLTSSILEFIEHRKTLKKPMSILAVKKFVSRLRSITTDIGKQINMIDEAIGSGWQSVYEPKNFNNSKKVGDSFSDFL